MLPVSHVLHGLRPRLAIPLPSRKWIFGLPLSLGILIWRFNRFKATHVGAVDLETYKCHTLPKLNTAPEKLPSQKDSSFPTPFFPGAKKNVKLRGCMWASKRWVPSRWFRDTAYCLKPQQSILPKWRTFWMQMETMWYLSKKLLTTALFQVCIWHIPVFSGNPFRKENQNLTLGNVWKCSENTKFPTT